MAFKKDGRAQSLGVVSVQPEDKTASQEIDPKTGKPVQTQAVSK